MRWLMKCPLTGSTVIKKGVKLDYSDNKNLIDKGFLKLLNDK